MAQGMWDACASKRGFVCGREAISIECAAGQGGGEEVESAIWMRKTKGEMEGRRGGRRKRERLSGPRQLT